MQGGKLLEIKVLDYLVIGQQRYVRLKSAGWGLRERHGSMDDRLRFYGFPMQQLPHR